MGKPLLIAFTGRAGAGKDTAADGLVEKLRLNKKSFATQMKLGVQTMFGLTDAQVYGDEKEIPIPWLSGCAEITPRYLLQTMGTDWGREMVAPDIWLHGIADEWETMKGIPGYAGMVIADLRFDNEAKWVEEQGGLVIRVDRPDGGLDLAHKSESGVSLNLINLLVLNNSTPRSLQERVYWLVEICAEGSGPKGMTPGYDQLITSSYPNPPFDKETAAEGGIGRIQSEIVAWADSVMPERTIANAIQKMVLEEIPEYLMAQDDAMELADLGILLYDIAHLAGVDLDQAIKDKMEINRKRRWKIDPSTGLLCHVKEGEG